jgi:RNA recognition motif-containing protein
MNIFVGNLSFAATEKDVKGLFETFGIVTSVSIKKKSGKNSRGFGFVIMPDDTQAEAAMAALQEKDFMGRPLSISVQRLKPVKPKKDYKEIKRLRMEAKNASVVIDDVPTIPEKVVELKPFKREEKIEKKSSQPSGSHAWEKRKGRGTAKPWKKKPGGVNKKFKHSK